mgnify:CR=1 FL=1
MEAGNPSRPAHVECSNAKLLQDLPAWDYVDPDTRAAILELPPLPLDAPETSEESLLCVRGPT